VLRSCGQRFGQGRLGRSKRGGSVVGKKFTARPILRVATPEQKGETLPLGPVLFSYTTRKPFGSPAPSSLGIHRSCSRQLQPKWKTQGFDWKTFAGPERKSYGNQ
jgi:hypothetical protein